MVPAPLPLSTIRNFGSADMFSFCRVDLSQQLKNYELEVPNLAANRYRRVNGRDSEVLAALVELFRAVLTEDPSARNVFHAPGGVHAYVYGVYYARVWTKLSLLKAARTAFDAIAVMLRSLIKLCSVSGTYKGLSYRALQIYNSYNVKPEWFAEQGVPYLMDVVRLMPPVVVWGCGTL
jgi:hypothetical protein